MTTDTTLHRRALAIITPALIDWAAKKNVRLGPDIGIAAQYALERIASDTLGSLLAFDPSALSEMRRAIFFTLDVSEMTQFYHCYAELLGMKIDAGLTFAACEKQMTSAYALAANTTEPLVWEDAMIMAQKQYAVTRGSNV